MTDLAALLAALDAGDDDVHTLRALADALEEAGVPWAAGMRTVCVVHPAKLPLLEDGRWSWARYPKRGAYLFHHLPIAIFRYLPPLDVAGRRGAPAMHYPTRSAAFLALAQAFAKVAHV